MMTSLFKLLVICAITLINTCSIQGKVFRCSSNAACGCSRNNADIDARIVGGEIVSSHSWGWAVQLRDYLNRVICGGTIISSRYIVTAAHCVESYYSSPTSLSVVVGSDTVASILGGQRIGVRSIHMHPNYVSVTQENDIAVLQLAFAIDLTNSNVAKICIPEVTSTQRYRYPIVGSPIVAIGWGTTASGGYTSDYLRQVTVNALDSSHSTCKDSIKNGNFQFCAGVNGGGKDTCQGDSGGPIMYYDTKKQLWVLAGITSYGRGCASARYAGVYTRASVYTEWLKSYAVNDGMVTLAQSKASVDRLSFPVIVSIVIFSSFRKFYQTI